MSNRRDTRIRRDLQFRKFRGYGFLKNLRFFDPFLLLFFREAGLSFLSIGLLISIREIATNVLEIPTGVLADVFGRRRAMLLGFAAYLGSFVLFYLGSVFWVFVLGMIAFAIGETFRSGTHKAMILEHLRITENLNRKVFYYGKTRAASQLGSAIAALVAAALVLWQGNVRIVFIASTVPYIANLLLLASYPRALDGKHAAHTTLQWGEIARRFGQAFRDLWAMLRDPCTLRGLLSSAGFDAVFKTTKDYLQPILQAQAVALPVLLALQDQQRTAILVGSVYFAIYLATSLASSRAGHVQSRFKSATRAVHLTFFLGIGLLTLGGAAAWIRCDAVAILAFLGVFVLQNLRRPIMVGYLADRMEHRAMASGLSVEVQLRTIMMVGLAPLLGWLADAVGVGAGIVALCIGVLVVSPLLMPRD